jgi:hypothetical protein
MPLKVTPSERLASIRAKHDWAMRQGADVERRIDEFLASANYLLNLDIKEPWAELSLLEVPPVPADIRLLFADLVHNLRSVLDHLVWHLVDLNVHKPPRNVSFPVVTDRERWPTAVDRQLRDFPQEWLPVIEWAQPFTVEVPTDHPAYYLHYLDNASKHRLLVGFGLTAAAIAHPQLRFNRPEQPGDGVSVIDEPGPFDLKPGEVLRRYRATSRLGDLRIVGVGVARESQIVLGPYRDDVEFPDTHPIKNAAYGIYVGTVLEALAPAFR